MSEQMFGIIIGASGAAISVMFGIVLRNVSKLGDRFDLFVEGCRTRHDDVICKEDYYRTQIPLEKAVDALHSRVDVIATKLDIENVELDRR